MGKLQGLLKPRVTMVLPRTKVLRSSAISMAGAEHLGLGHIVSYLRSLGYETSILNFQLSAFYNAWNGLVDTRNTYDESKLAMEILETNPDVVGFCITAMTARSAIEISKIIKIKNPKCIVGLGGPHAILCAKELFSTYEHIDFIGLSDGERAMGLLVDAVEKNNWPSHVPDMLVRGIPEQQLSTHKRYDGNLRTIEELPMPARDDLLSMIVNSHVNEARMTTSRGCTYQCSFCIDAIRYGRRWYARNPEQVVREMELLNRCLGIEHFWLSDDNFVTGSKASHRRAEAIADLILERGLNITYRARFRSDTFVNNPDLLLKLAKSGLISAYVGLEAGGQEQLNRYNKNTTIEQQRSIVYDLRSCDVTLQIGFIMFEPHCTSKDVLMSGEYLHGLEEMYLIGNFIQSLDVFPGAGITEVLRNDGLLSDKFGAMSSYDAYRFEDEKMGRLAKYLEQIHDKSMIERDKWIYRYRTTLFPRLRREIRKASGEGMLEQWQKREHDTISDLNDAHYEFFKQCVSTAESGTENIGKEKTVNELLRVSVEKQQKAVRELGDLFNEMNAFVVKGKNDKSKTGEKYNPINLPTSRYEKPLSEALKILGNSQPERIQLLPNGNLNYCLRLSFPKNEYVLRIRRDDLRSDISEYLNGLYNMAGFSAHKAQFSFRKPNEEVSFGKRLRELGINTPEPLGEGQNWVLNSYVTGSTIGDFLRNGGSPVIVLRLLNQLYKAHQNETVIGDRWGMNEIVDAEGNVHLIDFDISWGDKNKWLYGADSAVAIFGSLCHARNRGDLINCLEHYGLPLLKKWGYDLKSMAAVMDGYMKFYTDIRKPVSPLSKTPDKYMILVPDIEKIRDLLVKTGK